MWRLRSQAGQATVELVALLPALVLVAALAWQAAVAGQAAWLAGSAARAAARARAVGLDPLDAARSVLPRRLERGLRVRAVENGAVAVDVAVPLIGRGERLTTITARARFEPQDA